MEPTALVAGNTESNTSSETMDMGLSKSRVILVKS